MRIVNCYCNKNIDIKLFKKRLKQIKKIKIHYMLVSFFRSQKKVDYLRKHDIFGMLGDNVLFQPTKLPNNPKLIKIHNNVKIAADVTFYEHDVINEVFSDMYNEHYLGHMNCIEIYDNVFIGGKSIILGGVRIGPNAIVAAGSVVTKDVPEGSIVAGNPAKVVGSFEDLHKKRKNELLNNSNMKIIERYNILWKNFYNK